MSSSDSSVTPSEPREYIVNNYSVNKWITWIIVILFFVLIISVIYVLYQRNQTNYADPNNYQYIRVFHPASNTFLVARLYPVSDYVPLNDSTSPCYETNIAIGGTADDALGLWSFVGDSSTSTYKLQHAYTTYYCTVDVGAAPSMIHINGATVADANPLILSDAVGRFSINIRSPFTISLSDGRVITYSQSNGLLAKRGTPTQFILRLPVTQ